MSPVVTLKLSESLTFNAAIPLYETIRARMGQDISIDASAVQHIDANCAQVLMAAKSSSEAVGSQFLLSHCSKAFKAGLRDLGMASYLNYDRGE